MLPCCLRWRHPSVCRTRWSSWTRNADVSAVFVDKISTVAFQPGDIPAGMWPLNVLANVTAPSITGLLCLPEGRVGQYLNMSE